MARWNRMSRPFSENSPLLPNSPYAASKAAADLLVRAYHRSYGISTLITRCGNNYGPYQFPEKFLPLFITNALDDQDLPLYGDGKQIRDWIHVEDHARAVLQVLETRSAGRNLQHQRGWRADESESWRSGFLTCSVNHENSFALSRIVLGMIAGIL